MLAERLTDVLGVVALLALGALPFPGGPGFAVAGLGAAAVAALALTWRRGAENDYLWLIATF